MENLETRHCYIGQVGPLSTTLQSYVKHVSNIILRSKDMFTDRKTVFFFFLSKKYVHLLRMKINFFIEKIKNPSKLQLFFTKNKTIIYQNYLNIFIFIIIIEY